MDTRTQPRLVCVVQRHSKTGNEGIMVSQGIALSVGTRSFGGPDVPRDSDMAAAIGRCDGFSDSGELTTSMVETDLKEIRHWVSRTGFAKR